MWFLLSLSTTLHVMYSSDVWWVLRKCSVRKTPSLLLTTVSAVPGTGPGNSELLISICWQQCWSRSSIQRMKVLIWTVPQPPSCLSHLTSFFAWDLEYLFIANSILGFPLFYYLMELQYLEGNVHALWHGIPGLLGSGLHLESHSPLLPHLCCTCVALWAAWGPSFLCSLDRQCLCLLCLPVLSLHPQSLSLLKTHSSIISSRKIFLMFSSSIPSNFRLFAYIAILCTCVCEFIYIFTPVCTVFSVSITPTKL